MTKWPKISTPLRILKDGLATELLRKTCKGGLIFMCIAAYVSSNLKENVHDVDFLIGWRYNREVKLIESVKLLITYRAPVMKNAWQSDKNIYPQ